MTIVSKLITGLPAAIALSGTDEFIVAQGDANLKSSPLSALPTYLQTVSLSFSDTLFALHDNVDPTKIANFQLSGLSTVTTRTYSLPDASGTIVLQATTDTLSNKALDSSCTGVTQSPGDNTTKLATDAFVQAAVVAATTGVASIGGATGAFTLSHGIKLSTKDIEVDAGNVPGIAGNTAASAGNVGEAISATGTSGSLTSNTPVALGSIALTPGDWDISASAIFQTSGGTSVTDWNLSISQTSASIVLPITGTLVMHQRVPAASDHTESMAIPAAQALLSAGSTTFFLNASGTFTGTAPNVTWILRARRMR